MGTISTEKEIIQRFPVLYAHHSKKLLNLLQKCREINFEAGAMHVRVNVGQTGCGKTTEALVRFHTSIFN